MTRKIIRKPESRHDVDELAYYLAQRSRTAALRFFKAVEKAFKLLAATPEIAGRWETSNPAYANMRVWPIRGFPKHLIFYRPIKGGIEVIRVLYGTRDLDRMFATDPGDSLP